MGDRLLLKFFFKRCNATDYIMKRSLNFLVNRRSETGLNSLHDRVPPIRKNTQLHLPRSKLIFPPVSLYRHLTLVFIYFRTRHFHGGCLRLAVFDQADR
jgi:hypothetical protein